MKQLPLLLIGDTSEPWAVGSKLMRGANSLGLQSVRDVQVNYTSPSCQFSPSMSRISGKVFYRLADRRSWEWWGFQRQLLTQISQLKPKLIIVTGILPLKSYIFEEIRKQGGLICNYLTDDPWSPGNYRRCFIRNLSHYDHIFSTKEAVRRDLKKAGIFTNSWLPQAYDPAIHHPPKQKSALPGADVVFIGTGATERLPWLESLKDLPGLVRRIHGNNWGGFSTPGWERRSAATGEDYCRAIDNASIVLGLLRQSSRDLATDRSYEIGAIGGCGLYQDSNEHRELLPHYPEEGFFNSPKQLRERVQNLIDNPALRKQLRRLGAEALRRPEHTYGARLKTMLNWSGQW
ncbi:MAG: hypothetical protein CMQ14_02150 [Gammaproteobacteria bacterium]|nr:hypothetical protein [Gammaproteobacteria bacterium]